MTFDALVVSSLALDFGLNFILAHCGWKLVNFSFDFVQKPQKLQALKHLHNIKPKTNLTALVYSSTFCAQAGHLFHNLALNWGQNRATAFTWENAFSCVKYCKSAQVRPKSQPTAAILKQNGLGHVMPSRWCGQKCHNNEIKVWTT